MSPTTPNRREWLFFHGVLFVYRFSRLVGTRPVPTLSECAKSRAVASNSRLEDNVIQERFAIYCFSLENTCFAPVRYPEDGSKPLSEVLAQAAWVNQLIEQNGGTPPKQFGAVPSNFLPNILSYNKLQPINNSQPMGKIKENIFVVLMPGFNIDLETLELVLDSRYREYIKEKGIPVTLEQNEQKDILHLKPTCMGVGIDLKALWEYFRRLIR